MKKRYLGIILALCILIISGCGNTAGDDEIRYNQKLIPAQDTVLCIKALNSASIANLGTGAENIIRGAKNLSYHDAVFCEYDGSVYFESGNILYSVKPDGNGLKKVWKKGSKNSYELSIKGLYGSKILFSLIYTSDSLGIYDGEYIIYDAADGKSHSINGNSVENAFSYLITHSDDGKIYMASLSGSEYKLVCVDMDSEKITDLGRIDTSVNPESYPEWIGCIAGQTLYFTDRGSNTGHIYTMDLYGKETMILTPVDVIFTGIEPRFGDRICISAMASYKEQVYFLLNEFKDRDYEATLYSWDPGDNNLEMVDDCSHVKWLRNMLIHDDKYYIYSAEDLVTGSIR